MYRVGKPVRKNNRKAWLGIVLIVALLLAATYFIFIKNTSKKAEVSNNNSPLITNVTGDGRTSVTVNEPLFTLDLPGKWKETSRDSTPTYHSIQWNYTDKSANRWFRVYTDTIPADYAVNYLLPVTAEDNRLGVGQISDNCVTFTQGANSNMGRDVSTPASKEALPAKWQKVNFLCDNSHVTHQVVGTGSTQGGNAITVKGPNKGKHQYFFLYEDDNYHPDYSIFSDILNSFEAK
jgi:hypothetical protein